MDLLMVRAIFREREDSEKGVNVLVDYSTAVEIKTETNQFNPSDKSDGAVLTFLCNWCKAQPELLVAAFEGAVLVKIVDSGHQQREKAAAAARLFQVHAVGLPRTPFWITDASSHKEAADIARKQCLADYDEMYADRDVESPARCLEASGDLDFEVFEITNVGLDTPKTVRQSESDS